MSELNGSLKSWFHGFMTSDWRPLNKDIDKIGRPSIIIIGLVSSVGRASTRQSESRSIKSRLSKFFFVHPKFIMRKAFHNSLGKHYNVYSFFSSVFFKIKTQFIAK